MCLSKILNGEYLSSGNVIRSAVVTYLVEYFIKASMNLDINIFNNLDTNIYPKFI